MRNIGGKQKLNYVWNLHDKIKNVVQLMETDIEEESSENEN